jgi:hypothetical protein
MALPQTVLACDVAAQVFDQRGQHFGHCVPRVRIEPAPESQARPFFRSLHFFTGCYSVTDFMARVCGAGSGRDIVPWSIGLWSNGPRSEKSISFATQGLNQKETTVTSRVLPPMCAADIRGRSAQRRFFK